MELPGRNPYKRGWKNLESSTVGGMIMKQSETDTVEIFDKTL